MKFTKNVGTADRMARLILGLAILGAGGYYKSWFGAIGIILIGTAFLSFCPIYLPFKFKTNKN